MRRAIAVAVLAGPLLAILCGVYIFVATPDVITEYTEKSSSHEWGALLILLGLILGLLSAIIADMVTDR